MRLSRGKALIAAAGIAVITLGVTLPLQAAHGATPAAKPSPSPSPTPTASGQRLYFETGGITTLSGTGPTIVLNAPNAPEGVVAGNYLVNGTVTISEPKDGSSSTVSCNLQMGGVPSNTNYVYILDGIDAGGTLATLPLVYAYSGVSAGAHVALTCWVTGYANVVNSVLSVQQVPSVN